MMGKLFGKLFKTLTYRVEQEEKEWRSNNEIRQEFAYGWLRKFPIYLARKRFKRPFLIFLLFAFSTFILYLLRAEYLYGLPTDFNRSNLISYFTILWGAQATLAALIYPIVISFVALLLQRRHRAKSFLHIYLHDTAAVPSGLLAIGLIFLMTLQYYFFPFVEEVVGLNWLFIDGIFFLLNLSLTGFFVFQTFTYIRPTQRMESFKRYLINEVWPKELKNNLKVYFFNNSIKEELLDVPNGIDAKINDPSSPSIWTNRDFGSRGEAIVEQDLPKNRELTDVRFSILSLVAKRWSKKALKKMDSLAEDNSKQRIILKFPLRPGKKYSSKTTLCNIVGPVHLTRLDKWLIRRSFKFQKDNSQTELQVVELLDDLQADVLRSLRSGETQIYKEASHDLLDIIALLIKVSAFQNKDEKTDNYSRISSYNHPLWGDATYRDWFRKVYQIFEPATDRIATDDTYISEAISMPVILFYSLKNTGQTDILVEVLILFKNLNYRLGDWWSKTIENQGIYEHDEYNPTRLKPPYGGTYDNIQRSFIGKWEQLKNQHFIPREESDQNWNSFQSSAPLFESHLRFTGQLLLDAIYKGDEKRYQLFLDVFLKWYNGLRNDLSRHPTSILDIGEFINFEATDLSWDEIEESYDLNDLEHRPYQPIKLVYSSLLRNLWIDISCIILYKLLKDCSNSENLDNTLLAQACNAILKGEEPIRDGHSINVQKPINNATNLLIALIRQYHSGFLTEKNKYRARFRKVIRKLTEGRDSTMIPGRVYSGVGQEEDLRSLQVGQLLALTIFVNKNWDPTRDLESYFEKWVRAKNNQVNIFQRRLTEWIKLLASENFKKYENVYNQFSENEYSFKEAIFYARNGLIELKEKLDLKRTEVLKSIEISEKVIGQLKSEVSKEVNNNLTDIFPIPLFTEIDSCEQGLESYFFTFKECEKGWFIEPKISKRNPLQLRDYVGNILSKSINDIISKTINNVNLVEAEVDTQQEYWNEIQQYEKELAEKGKTPILIINGTTDPAWGWTREYRFNDDQIPDDLELSRDEDIQLESYRGHINKTEVHSSTTTKGKKTSLLVAKESFKELRKPDQKNFIDITPEEIEAESTLIDLKFSWKFKINIEEIEAILIKH